MPTRTAKKASKVTAPAAPVSVRARPPVEIPRPFRAPEGATHFLLRIGGKNGQKCYVSQASGVEVEWVDVRYWETETIRANWGNQHFYVKFSVVHEDGNRTQVGGWKNFRLTDPSAPRSIAPHDEEPQSHTAQIVPSGTSADAFGQSLTILASLRSMVSADANVQIEAERMRSNAFLELMRAQMASHQQAMMSLSRPAGTDPGLALLARALEEGNKAQQAAAVETQRLLKELTEEEPDDPEEDDAKRIERLGKTVKKSGVVAAIQEYMGEETALTIAKQMPLIKSKLPEVFSQLQGFLKTFMSEPAAPVAAPPLPAPGPEPTPSSPPKVKARPAPPPAPNGVPRDSLAPTIK